MVDRLVLLLQQLIEDDVGKEKGKRFRSRKAMADFLDLDNSKIGRLLDPLQPDEGVGTGSVLKVVEALGLDGRWFTDATIRGRYTDYLKSAPGRPDVDPPAPLAGAVVTVLTQALLDELRLDVAEREALLRQVGIWMFNGGVTEMRVRDFVEGQRSLRDAAHDASGYDPSVTLDPPESGKGVGRKADPRRPRKRR